MLNIAYCYQSILFRIVKRYNGTKGKIPGQNLIFQDSTDSSMKPVLSSFLILTPTSPRISQWAHNRMFKSTLSYITILPSAMPHGYFLPLTFLPSTSITVLEPTTAKGTLSRNALCSLDSSSSSVSGNS